MFEKSVYERGEEKEKKHELYTQSQRTLYNDGDGNSKEQKRKKMSKSSACVLSDEHSALYEHERIGFLLCARLRLNCCMCYV